jgi:hypothetical protein
VITYVETCVREAGYYEEFAQGASNFTATLTNSGFPELQSRKG